MGRAGSSVPSVTGRAHKLTVLRMLCVSSMTLKTHPGREHCISDIRTKRAVCSSVLSKDVRLCPYTHFLVAETEALVEGTCLGSMS